MSKRGLPSNFRLRHDAHYVELVSGRPGGVHIGRMIGIDKLAPNPNQPRVEIGDLAELIDSVREKGILEPLLVRPSEVGGRFMIISGERRYRAALEAGLAEVPCIEMSVDDRAVAEISLIENLQRKDLTPFEEADGLRALAERFGYTHEEIARKVGKSRTSVTEALSLVAIPEDVRDICRRADISSKSMLLQVVRQPDTEQMREFATRIHERGITRDEARKVRRDKSKRATSFVFRYKAKNQSYSLVMSFRKAQVRREELEKALKEALEHVRRSE
ncbi:MAG TPA: ParB/RepB/Spo0J family partition protein [Blastocatellia bacterium]|nr:ParB/RepB/Spo0J family partition protein [Blastocatellia bacterium]